LRVTGAFWRWFAQVADSLYPQCNGIFYKQLQYSTLIYRWIARLSGGDDRPNRAKSQQDKVDKNNFERDGGVSRGMDIRIARPEDRVLPLGPSPLDEFAKASQ